MTVEKDMVRVMSYALRGMEIAAGVEPDGDDEMALLGVAAEMWFRITGLPADGERFLALVGNADYTLPEIERATREAKAEGVCGE